MNLSQLLDSQEGLPLSTLKMMKLKKSVIKRLMLNENTTIADICRDTQVSVPTVTKVISELIEDNIVFEKGKIASPGGRRPFTYGINPNSAFFLGVDVHRNFISIGLQNFTNEFVKVSTSIDYTLVNTRESLYQMCDIINRFITKSGIKREKILGACVAFVGRINTEKGYSHNYFFFEEEPLSKIIESRIKIKTFMENDSRAMAYGEFCSGVAAGGQNVIYLNLSWGFGIGIINNGELQYGKSGYSGEFGHSSVLSNEIICQCGKKGCLETEISGQALVRRFREKLQEGSTTMLTSKMPMEDVTMYDIITAAVNYEDLLAIELIEEIGEKLGHYLSLLLNIFNPDLVIIGGDFAAAGPYIKLPVETALRKYSLNLVVDDMDLKMAELGDRAGVIGACYVLRDKLFKI